MSNSKVANKYFLEQLVRKVLFEQSNEDEEEYYGFGGSQGSPDDGFDGAQGSSGQPEYNKDSQEADETGAGDAGGSGGEGGAGSFRDDDESGQEGTYGQALALQGHGELGQIGFWDDFWSACWANYKSSAVSLNRMLFANGDVLLHALQEYDPGQDPSKKAVKTFLQIYSNPDASQRGEISYGALGPGTGKGEAGQVFIWQDPDYYGFRQNIAKAMTKFLSYKTGSPEKGRRKFWKELIKEIKRAEEEINDPGSIGPSLNYFWQKHWRRFGEELNSKHLVDFAGIKFFSTSHPTGIEGIQATDTATGPVNAKLSNQEKAQTIGERLGMSDNEMNDYFYMLKNHYLEEEQERFDSAAPWFTEGWSMALGTENKELKKKIRTWIKSTNDPELSEKWVNVITGTHITKLKSMYNGHTEHIYTPSEPEHYHLHRFVAEMPGGMLTVIGNSKKAIADTNAALGMRPKPDKYGRWPTGIRLSKKGTRTKLEQSRKPKKDGVYPTALYERIMFLLFPPKRIKEAPGLRMKRMKQAKRSGKLIQFSDPPSHTKFDQYFDTGELQPYEVEIEINKKLIQLAENVTRKRWLEKTKKSKEKAEKAFRGAKRGQKNAYKYKKTPDWWTWTHEWDEATTKRGNPRSTWGKVLKHLAIDTPKFYSDLFKEELEKFYEETKLNEQRRDSLAWYNQEPEAAAAAVAAGRDPTDEKKVSPHAWYYDDMDIEDPERANEDLQKLFFKHNIQINDFDADWNFQIQVNTTQGPKRQTFDNLMRSVNFSMTEAARKIDVKNEESFPDWCPLDCFVLFFDGVLENYHAAAVISKSLDKGKTLSNPLEDCEKKYEVKDESKIARWARDKEQAEQQAPRLIRSCKQQASKSMDIRINANTFNFSNILDFYQESIDSGVVKGDRNFLLQVAKDHSRMGTEKWFEKYHKKPFVSRLISDKHLLSQWLPFALIANLDEMSDTYLGKGRAFWTDMAKAQMAGVEAGEWFGAANLVSILLLNVIFDAEGAMALFIANGLAAGIGAVTGTALGAGAVSIIVLAIVIIYCLMVWFNVGGWFNYTDNINSLMVEMETILSQIDDIVQPIEQQFQAEGGVTPETLQKEYEKRNEQILDLLEGEGGFRSKAQQVVNFVDEIVKSGVRKSLQFEQFAPQELFMFARQGSDYISNFNDMLQIPFDVEEANKNQQFLIPQKEINDAMRSFAQLKEKILEFTSKLEGMGEDKGSFVIKENFNPIYDSLLFEKAKLIVEETDDERKKREKAEKYDADKQDKEALDKKFRDLIKSKEDEQAKQVAGGEQDQEKLLSFGSNKDTSVTAAADTQGAKSLAAKTDADALDNHLIEKIINFHRLFEFRKGAGGLRPDKTQSAIAKNNRQLAKIQEVTQKLKSFDPKISASSAKWTSNFIKNTARQFSDISTEISEKHNQKIDFLRSTHNEVLTKFGWPKIEKNEEYADFLNRVAPELSNTESKLLKALYAAEADVKHKDRITKYIDLITDSEISLYKSYARETILSNEYLKKSTSQSGVYNFTRSGLVTAKAEASPIVATSVYALHNYNAPDINKISASNPVSFDPKGSFYNYSSPESDDLSRLITRATGQNEVQNIVTNLLKRFIPAYTNENLNVAISADNKGVHPIEVLFQYAQSEKSIKAIKDSIILNQNKLAKFTSDAERAKAAGRSPASTGLKKSGKGLDTSPVAPGTQTPQATGQVNSQGQFEAMHKIKIYEYHLRFIGALFNALNNILAIDKAIYDRAESGGPGSKTTGGVFSPVKPRSAAGPMPKKQTPVQKVIQPAVNRKVWTTPDEAFEVMKMDSPPIKLKYVKKGKRRFVPEGGVDYWAYHFDIVKAFIGEKEIGEYFILRKFQWHEKVEASRRPDPNSDQSVRFWRKYWTTLDGTVWAQDEELVGFIGIKEGKEFFYPKNSVLDSEGKKVYPEYQLGSGTPAKRALAPPGSSDQDKHPDKSLPEAFWSAETFMESIKYDNVLLEQENNSTSQWAAAREKAVKLYAVKNSCLEALYRIDRLLLEEDVRMYSFTKYFWDTELNQVPKPSASPPPTTAPNE